MAETTPGALKCRNVKIDGRRTSIKLEQEFWRLLAALARESGMEQEDILSRIRAARPLVPLTTSVRVAVLLYQEMAARTLPQPDRDTARDRLAGVLRDMGGDAPATASRATVLQAGE